jgi:hypothetical protein
LLVAFSTFFWFFSGLADISSCGMTTASAVAESAFLHPLPSTPLRPSPITRFSASGLPPEVPTWIAKVFVFENS